MIDVSIIVPTFNEVDYIKNCLDSLSDQNYPEDEYEVLVVDSHSTDGTIDVVKSYCDLNRNYRLIFEHRKSASAARNKGIGMSRGRIIAFVDGDTIIPRNWLNTINDNFSNNQNLGVIGGPDYTPADDPYISKMIGLTENSERTFSCGLEDEEAIAWIKSCNCALKIKSLNNVGGFEENVPSRFYFDETPLWHKIYHNGYNIYFDPEMYVFHRRQKSIRKFLSTAYRYGASKAMLGYKDSKDMVVISVLLITSISLLAVPFRPTSSAYIFAILLFVLNLYVIKRFYRGKNFGLVLKNLPVIAALFYLKWVAWASGILFGFRWSDR